MNTHILMRGAVAGAVGGMVMAMWSMIVLWLTGDGFWQPLNLIAHTFWRGAPLDATYSVGAMFLGLIVHMMMSMMLGAAFALAVQKVHLGIAALAGVGMIFGLVVWAVMQYAVWRAIDTDAAKAFTPWVFAIGHAMFGAVTALVVAAPSPAATGHTSGHTAIA